MRALRSYFFLFILSFTLILEASPPDLTPRLARKKAEEILKYHVLYKQLNPELAKRALKNYLDSLDQIKTYLIADEVAKWDDPSDFLLKKVIEDYNHSRFDTFQEIYTVMLNAIERRAKIEEEIAALPLPEDVDAEEFQEISWAESVDDLKTRLLRVKALQVKAAESFDLESKEQFSKRVAKMRRHREEHLVCTSQAEQKKQMLALSLKAITSGLDSNTSYLTPKEANQMMVQMQQRLFGIGAQLRDDLNGLTLVRLIEGGPAANCEKLKEGDRIVAVDDTPILGMECTEAVELIRGPQGTNVHLTLVRDDEKFTIDIIRDEIVFSDTRIEHETIPFGDGVIAHIHLHTFYEDANFSSRLDVKNAIDSIKKEHTLYGVILDLRNNGGGMLTQAVGVAGLFINKGIVVSIKDNKGAIKHLRNFDGATTWDGPLVLLVNRLSASSSEIVSQTLQDYGRALLVGDDRTFGKGSYQIVTVDTNHNNVNPQGEYKVTLGLYYTVSGASPQLKGALTDVTVPGHLMECEVGEAFGRYPLKNDCISANFEDDLSDVHPFHRLKLNMVYKQDLQEKVTTYEPYIEQLKINSAKRIEQNVNYQNYLTAAREKSRETAPPFGQNDLQLEEAVNVMQDLILLMR